LKSHPSPPMTLGNAAAARVRLIVWCKACQHQVEPNHPHTSTPPTRARAPARESLHPDLPPGRAPRLAAAHRARCHYRVSVRDDGFSWQGTRCRSLSAIARKITGTAWSGPLFFGLKQTRSAGRRSSPVLLVQAKPACRQGFREPCRTLATFVTLASIQLVLRRLARAKVVGSTIHDDGGQQTRAVPAAKGERLLSVRSTDLRRSVRQ
jgi:Protein of unknown function (DUF2924)